MGKREEEIAELCDLHGMNRLGKILIEEDVSAEASRRIVEWTQSFLNTFSMEVGKIMSEAVRAASRGVPYEQIQRDVAVLLAELQKGGH